MLGCVTRLYGLDHPNTPVYDETHVGRFLNWYTERAFFFDVHPPLAKLLMLWVGTALGFQGRDSCAFDESHAPCDMAALRLVPALCGAAMLPVVVVTGCAMKLDIRAAILAGWLLLIDPLWIGLSRIALNDMVQMLFIALTHFFALHACSMGTHSTANARPTSESMRVSLSIGDVAILAATGTSLGCALQCKYAMALTTVAWLGIQNLTFLVELIHHRCGVRTLLLQAACRGLLLLGVPLLLHLLFFCLHLQYLPNSGNGDGYMSERFQATLNGSRFESLVAPDLHLGWFGKLREHAIAQLSYNRNMAILFPQGSHQFDSRWYTWPLAWRGVYFTLTKDWTGVASSPTGRHVLGMYIQPSPVIVLLTTFAALACAIGLCYAALRLALFSLCPSRGSAAAKRCSAIPERTASQTAISAPASPPDTSPSSAAAPASVCAFGTTRASNRQRQLFVHFRPGGVGSLLLAYVVHLLPYATQQRQTFVLYYLPAYYFAILLTARVWHTAACVPWSAPLRNVLIGALCFVTGYFSFRISAIAYAAPTTVWQWNQMLQDASTECWVESGTCWATRT
eukprot:CAMPEP_0119344792 /NCGR_PEP_ID=MMETSP1333-20130426/107152_1 /TAXON_ID=418940 /ORGANISM="Scyphosphaera apsteinii, Strain RCC1455" /LENGTH=567 /DNA_ID=CAMNT_0007357239 /DNA_START=128 /DNA_END=1831 /DNA_ORIENTATION=-